MYNIENKEDITVCEMVDTYYPCVDGVIGLVRNYGNRLNKKAHCFVAVPKASKKSGYVDNEEFEVLRCKSLGAPENYRCALPFFDHKFKKAVEKREPDIIHTHSPFSLARFAIKLGKKKHIPVVITLHTKYRDDFMRSLKGNKPLVKFMMKYMMKAFNNADSVWTVSNASKEVLREYGYKGDIQVVRNGTDYVYPDNPKEYTDIIDEKHDLKGQKNVFLFVGRLAMYKNLKLLCDSLKILKDRGLDFKMIFVGGGFDKDELARYIKEKDIKDRCIMTGEVDDRKILQAYFLRSDLMLFPSVFDMASVTTIEAAANKLPSVVIEGACTAETITDNVSGFYSKENAEDYANRIAYAVSDENRLKEISENAYKMVYRSWDKVVEEAYGKYKEIIKEYKEKHTEKIKKKN